MPDDILATWLLQPVHLHTGRGKAGVNSCPEIRKLYHNLLKKMMMTVQCPSLYKAQALVQSKGMRARAVHARVSVKLGLTAGTHWLALLCFKQANLCVMTTL